TSSNHGRRPAPGGSSAKLRAFRPAAASARPRRASGHLVVLATALLTALLLLPAGGGLAQPGEAEARSKTFFRDSLGSPNVKRVWGEVDCQRRGRVRLVRQLHGKGSPALRKGRFRRLR